MKEALSNFRSQLSKLWNGAKGGMSGQGMSRAKSQLKLENPIRSVGTKLLLIFFVSIVAMVLAVGISSYQISKSVIKDKVAGASHQTIVQATDKIDFLLESMENMSIQIMSDDAIADNMSKYRDMSLSQYERLQTGQAVHNRLKNYVMSNSKIADANIIPLKESDTTYRSNSTLKSELFTSPWFESVKAGDGKAVWLPTTKAGYVSSPNTFAVARVLRNIKSGSVEGVLVLEIKPSALKEALGDLSIGKGSEVTIVSPDNKILYSDNSELLEADFNIDLASQIKDSGEKSTTFETSKGGSSSLVVYDPVERSGWFVAGTMPVGELVKDAKRISDIMWLTVLIAAIVAVVIGYVVIRMIARPLESVRNLMMEGARGNLTVRTKFEGRRDEIGQLASSFNEMMEQITNLVSRTNVSAQEVLNTAAELSDASKKTALSAKEIAVATEEIANGASSLAVEAERGSDLTGGISRKVGLVVEANAHMEHTASEVQMASQKGITYMSELITKTNMTEEMTRSMVEKVEKLQESTSSIRKILEMLNNITRQTNILSLNATIEAARAGAAGKGFMVVADEIRKLADQSKQSIDIVAQITDRIQTEMQETVAVLSEAYPIFKEQIVSVKDADEIFKQVQGQMVGFLSQLSEVTGSVQELHDSQSVLSEAMGNVSAVAQQSSATSEEVASLSSEQLSISGGLVRLSEKLEELSNSLKESLSKFSI